MDDLEREVAHSLHLMQNHVSRHVRIGTLTPDQAAQSESEYRARRVAEVPPGAPFTPPMALLEILSPANREQLAAINESFQDLNNALAGDLMIEAFVSLGHSSDSHDLKQRIFAFCEGYAREHFAGVTFSSPRQKAGVFHKVLGRWRAYLDALQSNQATFGFYYYPQFHACMAWHLVRRMVTPRDHGDPAIDAIRRYCSEELRFVEQFHDMAFFLRRNDVRFTSAMRRLATMLPAPPTLEAFAEDLREMRPILAWWSKTAKRIVPAPELGEGYAALWQWETNGDCIGRICIAKGEHNLVRQASHASRSDAKYERIFRVNHVGQLACVDLEWFNTGTATAYGHYRWAALNLLLLQRFHALFMVWYSKVDFAAMRREPVDASSPDGPSEEAQVHAALREVIEAPPAGADPTDPAGGPSWRSQIRQMRSDQLFRILTTLGVRVAQGKGSEINLFHNKTFRLGHHTRRPEISSGKIAQILRRLGIDLQTFVEAAR